jgi:hypothetical protein
MVMGEAVQDSTARLMRLEVFPDLTAWADRGGPLGRKSHNQPRIGFAISDRLCRYHYDTHDLNRPFMGGFPMIINRPGVYRPHIRPEGPVLPAQAARPGLIGRMKSPGPERAVHG